MQTGDSVTRGEDGPGLADVDGLVVVSDLLLDDAADLGNADVHASTPHLGSLGGFGAQLVDELVSQLIEVASDAGVQHNVADLNLSATD